MQTLIIEGIATSGKTTLVTKLKDYLASHALPSVVVTEEETLMPVLGSKDREVALQLLRNVIRRVYMEQDTKVVIFERLYFTHIFRTASTLSDFREIEELLLPNNPEIVFLQISEQAIQDRIQTAMTHRDEDWVLYVKQKGTDTEIADYYISQQRQIIAMLKESAIPSTVFDTTSMQFDQITDEVIKRFIVNA